MTEPDVPDYIESVTPPGIHTDPPTNYQWQNPSQDQVNSLRDNLLESIFQVIVQAVTGVFTPGGGDGDGLNQLSDWAGDIGTAILDAIDQAGDLVQGLLDTVFNGLGGQGIGHQLEELLAAFHVIPGTNVVGGGGGSNVVEDFFKFINGLVGGAVGKPGSTGAEVADVQTVMGILAQQSAQGSFAWTYANQINFTPQARGFLPGGRANYEFSSANTFVPSTQSAALTSSMGMQENMPVGATSWYGYGTSGMTAFYVNIRKVNLATGERDLVHHSANILADIQPGSTAADADWMYYVVPSPLAGEKGFYYYWEWVPVGGTHYIRGNSSADTIKDNLQGVVPCFGSSVDYSSSPNVPTPTLPKAVSGPNLGWIEFAPALAGIADHHEPQLVSFETDGETVAIPNWANRVDFVPCSGGGKGSAATGFGFNGKPGQPGKFAPITVERGVHYSGSATIITFSAPGDGTATIGIPGTSTTSTPGADGVGTSLGSTPIAQGPEVLEYNGQPYTGGGEQKAGGGKGMKPGGAGNGGVGVFGGPGGLGGDPGGWVLFRQVAVTDEEAGDTTPPVVGILTLDSRTRSTISVTAEEATD